MYVSATAYQRGFGCDKYKTVHGLTKEERQMARDGKEIYFRSRPAGGTHGTTWRIVLVYTGNGKPKYVPRVPDAETCAMLDAQTKEV